MSNSERESAAPPKPRKLGPNLKRLIAHKMSSRMTASEKARKLCIPLYAEIHHDIGGMLSMGDIACIIGQRMNDVCMEMHEWAERDTRERCAQIVENEPLGYITESEHEKLENFADRVAERIRGEE